MSPLHWINEIKGRVPEKKVVTGDEKISKVRLAVVMLVCLTYLMAVFAIETVLKLPPWFGLVMVFAFAFITAPFIRRIKEWLLE